MVGEAQTDTSLDLHGAVPDRGCRSPRALPRLDRLLRLAYYIEVVGELRVGLSQPILISESRGQDLGLAKMVKDPLDLAQLVEHSPQFETNINGLLARLATLWEVTEHDQRLLQVRRRFGQRRTPFRLGPGLAE